MFGGLRPIQWIARYRYRKGNPSKPWAKSALPVRIARSALGPNVPHDDLYLTSWHSVLIDGVLVPAGSLINATLDEAGEYDELEYFHLKLESHDVIYAEGARSKRSCTWTNARSISPSISAYVERRKRQRLGARRLFAAMVDVSN